MLTLDQLNTLERDLWASTAHPQVYALLRDNKAVRDDFKALIGAVYKLVSTNYHALKQDDILWNVEMLLTLAEEKLE